MQFQDWDFSHDLSAAVHVVNGEEVRFTRAERSLLQALISYKGRIWTRDRLLDAVSGIYSETADRSIDFLINRLRRKLRDSARHPRYIETRYGEGYVWIAASPELQPVNHAAMPPIRTRLRGDATMSYCDRPAAERTVIRRYAHLVLILRLQGFLYYGAANRLFEEVQHDVQGELQCLIVDLRDVQGVDDTALSSLRRLEKLAQDRGLELIFSSVRPVIENHLSPLAARRFGSLDVALEWRENRILEAKRPETPLERTLASRLAEEVDDADATTIVGQFEVIHVPPGETIIKAASTTRDMFFLERGTAEVRLNVEGEWVRASRIWPGTLFGEIGFHCGGARTATVRSVDGCRLVRMERRTIDRLEARFPALAAALHRFLARSAAERLILYTDMVVDFFRSTLR